MMVINSRAISMLVSLATIVIGLGDNKGRHFILGFIENRILVQQPIIRIYVTSHEVGAVTFSVPLERATYPPVTKTVRKGVTAIQEYPYELHMIGTDYNTKCITIDSTVDVTVQAASVNNLTSDVYLALPTWALGQEYYVMSFLYSGTTPHHVHGPSQFGVIALEADTDVTFHRPPMVHFVGMDSVSLRRYEAYQVQSATSDLTGVKVMSTKPVAIMSGTVWTAVGGMYMGDHLVEMLSPVNTWGAEFFVPPLSTRSNGDVIKVLAANENTRVRVTEGSSRGPGLFGFLLGPGEHFSFNTPRTPHPIHIVSNKGISVAQFAKSYAADNNRYADPMMMMIPPISQYTTWYTFSVLKTIRTSDNPQADVRFNNFLSLVVPMDTIEGIRYDGRPIPGGAYVQQWYNKPGLTRSFAIVTIKVMDGRMPYHIVGHTSGMQPFGAFLYGFKLQESYGMPLGCNFTTITHTCIPTLTFEGDFVDNDCDGKYDEEILNGKDDDFDGHTDEDLEPGVPATTIATQEMTAIIDSTNEPKLTTMAVTMHEGSGESTGEGKGSNTGGGAGGIGGSASGSSGGGTSGTSGRTGGTGGSGDRTNGSADGSEGSTGGTGGNAGGIGTNIDGGTEAGSTGGESGGTAGGTGGGTGGMGDSTGTSDIRNSTNGTDGPTGTNDTINGNAGNTGRNASIGVGVTSSTGDNIRGVAGNKDRNGDIQTPTSSWYEGDHTTTDISYGNGVNENNNTDNDVAINSTPAQNGTEGFSSRNKTVDPNISGIGNTSQAINGSSTDISNESNNTVTVNGNRQEGLPKGIRCEGSGCNLLINATSIAWRHIRQSADQAESFGVHWEETFWMLQGDTWQVSGPLTHLMNSSNQTFCLLAQAMIWCYSTGRWEILLEVLDIPNSDMWPDTYALNDWGAWILAEGSIRVSSSHELSRKFGFISKWNRLQDGKRLGILWKATVWIFGEGSVEHISWLPNVTLHWHSIAWTWDGSGWYVYENNPLWILNNTLSISWNRKLWIWNGTHWEEIEFPGSTYTHYSDGIFISWNNITWLLGNSSRPIPIPSEGFPGGLVQSADRPIIGLKNTTWILTPNGEWISIARQLQPPDHLFDHFLGASWQHQFWIYNETTKTWLDSLYYQDAFLTAEADIPHPAILADGIFWQWDGLNWIIRFERSVHRSMRRKREIQKEHTLKAWWGEEAWQLFQSTWMHENTSLLEAVGIKASTAKPKLVLAVDSDIWIYNGSDWGLDADNNKLTSDQPSAWINESLGFISNGNAWTWDKDTLTSNSKASREVNKMELKDSVGVVKEGTLWWLDGGHWSNGFLIVNTTVMINGETRVGVLVNGTLWFLRNGEWEKCTGNVIIINNEMNSKSAAIINQTLWILDKEQLHGHKFSIIPDELSGLNIIWQGQLWVFNQNNNWTSASLPEYYRGEYPDDCIVIYGEVWAIAGQLLIKDDDKLATSSMHVSSWQPLRLFYMYACHKWSNFSFIIQENCLNEGELTKASEGLVVVTNDTKWILVDNKQWLVLPTQSINNHPWANDVGVIVNETVWLWNGSNWIHILDEAPDARYSRDSVAVFRNGYLWRLGGNDWLKQTVSRVIRKGIVSSHGFIKIDFNGGTWFWNDTDMIPSFDVEGGYGGGKTGGYLQVGLSIAEIAWICNQTRCWSVLTLKDFLDESTIAIGVNNNLWLWNETASLSINNLSEKVGGVNGELYIYIDHTVWVWNGTSLVKPSISSTGKPAGGTVPNVKQDTQNGSRTHADASMPGLILTLLGTGWVWDGQEWTAANRMIRGQLPFSTNVSVTFIGNSWLWNGSSWVEQLTDAMEEAISEPMQHETTPDLFHPSYTQRGAATYMDMHYSTDETQLGTATSQEVDTVDLVVLNASNTRSTNELDNKSTVGVEHTTETTTTYTPHVSSKGSSGGDEGTVRTLIPREPNSAAATEENDFKVAILAIIVILVILFLILIILLWWWCSKHKRQKAAAQKVNPAVATVAVPRPNSHFQDPPLARRPSGSSSCFNDPSTLIHSAQWSSDGSSSSIGYDHYDYTPRRSRGRRSPRVSQAPPVDLPDLIISLPVGQHIHLKSPSLSPDPSPSLRWSL